MPGGPGVVLQAKTVVTVLQTPPQGRTPCSTASALTRWRTRLRDDLDDLPGHGAPDGAQRQGVRLLARRLPRSCAAALRRRGLLPVLHLDHARDAVRLKEHLPAQAWIMTLQKCMLHAVLHADRVRLPCDCGAMPGTVPALKPLMYGCSTDEARTGVIRWSCTAGCGLKSAQFPPAGRMRLAIHRPVPFCSL